MDALRPSMAMASSVAQRPAPPSAKAPRAPRSDGRLGTLPSIAAAKPSPNSMAPVVGTTSPAAACHKAPRSGNSTGPVVPAQRVVADAAAALPPFLSRRPPQPPPVVAPLGDHDRHDIAAPHQTLGVLPSASSGATIDDEARLCALLEETVDEMVDEPLVDEAVFEQCLDLEEEEKTEDDLKQLAEELSVTTGLTHAEVLALLLEQQAEKQQMRRARDAERKSLGLVRLPRREGEGDVGRSSFLTETPDLCATSGVKQQAQRKTASQPPRRSGGDADSSSADASGPSKQCPSERSDVTDGDVVDLSAFESEATKRMRQQLMELFPSSSSSSTTGGGAAPSSAHDEDSFVDLKTFRAERAARVHARVANHLASRRGSVPVPRSLETTDMFVRAYELEMSKRASQRIQKEETLRRQRDEQEKERKAKGLLCNLAIQQKIVDRYAATTSAGTAQHAPPSQLL